MAISRQIIVAWAGSKRPISRLYSSQIAKIVAMQHDRRRSRERSRYVAMIDSLNSESARVLMLAMLADEIEIRVQAVAVLARNGSSSDQKAKNVRLSQEERQ